MSEQEETPPWTKLTEDQQLDVLSACLVEICKEGPDGIDFVKEIIRRELTGSE
jgi:hypothetical protein